MPHNYYQVQVGHNVFQIDRRYTHIKLIGDGSYGIVASAYDEKTRRPVAIKKVQRVFADLIDAKRILRELKLLKHFNSHENIISIIDIMTMPYDTIDFQDIYIVTNLMESDLERIIRSKQELTDQHFQYFLYQILRGLKYIHSGNVLHRDLKPSNLLVNSNCDLAVCDFGLARGFHSEGNDTLTEYVVTRWYRAPELLCEADHYGKAVDIWGVGCIFAELLTHEAFFQGSNPLNQLEQIVAKVGCPNINNNNNSLDFVKSPVALNRIMRYEGKSPPVFQSLFPSKANPSAIDLLRRMLAFHPNDRISVEEALSHPYLSAFHGQMSEPVCDDRFEFDFEQTADAHKVMSQLQVQSLMYTELIKFRKGHPRVLEELKKAVDSGAVVIDNIIDRESIISVDSDNNSNNDGMSFGAEEKSQHEHRSSSKHDSYKGSSSMEVDDDDGYMDARAPRK